MSSTGVYRFIALCAEIGLLAAPVFALPQDCPSSQPGVRETQARLGQLETSAQEDLQERRFAEAALGFREAACLAPSDPRILYSLGVAQAGSGDFLAARKSLEAARSLQPANPLPLAMLVRVNFSLGDIDSLKAALRASAAEFPQDFELHSMLAQFLIQSKLLDLALAESLRAMRANPNPTPQATVELAAFENTAGAFDDAIRNAMRIESQIGVPNALRAAAMGVAGLSEESAGRPEAAVIRLREAIQLDPSRENSYLALAFLYEKMQKFGEAVGVLEEGRRKLPESVALLLPLGSNLVRVERYPEAVAVLERLLRHSPDESEAYLRLADAYRKTGNYAGEVRILSVLAAREPDYPAVHILISNALLDRAPADYPKVLDELNLAEKNSPSDAQTFYLRAKVYLATGRDEQARLALTRSIELAPMDPAPYYRLGRLLLKMGEPKLAREILDRMPAAAPR